MMSLRTSFSRTASLMATHHSRMLSSQGNIAVEKLRSILEEYRRSKYVAEGFSDTDNLCKRECEQTIPCLPSSNL